MLLVRTGHAGSRAGSRAARPVELLIGFGFFVVVVASVVAALVFSPRETAGRLLVLSFAVGWFAITSRSLSAALTTAGMGWLFLNGFLVDQHSELAWHGSADLVRLVVLAFAALAGTAAGNFLAPERSRDV